MVWNILCRSLDVGSRKALETSGLRTAMDHTKGCWDEARVKVGVCRLGIVGYRLGSGVCRVCWNSLGSTPVGTTDSVELLVDSVEKQVEQDTPNSICNVLHFPFFFFFFFYKSE